MKKIKIGVFGVYRGNSMINYCSVAKNAEVVAVCDKWKEALERQKESHKEKNIVYYESFDDFLKHDMDAVVLANYANEHAPYAIKALRAGKHVYSEVLPVQTMKEAVELIEAVEETGKIYAYGENYCYIAGPYEMRRLYREGKIGEVEYAECEYFHNSEDIWPCIAYGDPEHWRNNMYSTFYCTHSFGPIRHITGLRPVSVIGFESGTQTSIERNNRMGCKGGAFGIEMITLENGAIVKSGHGNSYGFSIWYTVSGEKGRLETAREDAQDGLYDRIYISADEYPGECAWKKPETYIVDNKLKGPARDFGHGGSDFWSMHHFIEKLLGNKDADTIDVYEALDMCMVGMFAYRSILKGGFPMQIPNLRDKAERDKWRTDTACVDPKVAGEQLLPTRKDGTPNIDREIYEHQRKLFKQHLLSDTEYIKAAFAQPDDKQND